MSLPLLTVTLNAAVDKTFAVPGFTLGRVHRPIHAFTTAGGKGINVARVLHTLGASVTATGFLGGRNGDWIAAEVAHEGIAERCVRVDGESRLCIAVMDAGTQTEVNEIGPPVTEGDCAALIDVLRELLPSCRAVVYSGSAPPGVPATFYRDLIRLAQEEYDVCAVLDASGDLLRRGMEAKPFLVKPNVFEAAMLGIQEASAADAARRIREQFGVTLALVTAGAQGAVLAGDEGTWEATPPSVEIKSAVGSGDSLLASFLWSWSEGHLLSEALRYGVGAGAANAAVYGAGFCSKEDILASAAQTRVRLLD